MTKEHQWTLLVDIITSQI